MHRFNNFWLQCFDSFGWTLFDSIWNFR